ISGGRIRDRASERIIRRVWKSRRAEPISLRQEQRERSQVSGICVAIDRHEATWIPTDCADQGVDAVAVESHGKSPAKDCLSAVTENMLEKSVPPARRPGETQARRKIAPVSVVGGRTFFELDKLSGAGGRIRDSRIKDIADAGNAI